MNAFISGLLLGLLQTMFFIIAFTRGAAILYQAQFSAQHNLTIKVYLFVDSILKGLRCLMTYR